MDYEHVVDSISSWEASRFEEATGMSVEEFLFAKEKFDEMMNNKILTVMDSQLEGANGVWQQT